jgi:TatD DNase family protein
MELPVGEAVAAAKAVGIERMVTIGIDVPSSEWAAQAAAAHDDVFATVAIRRHIDIAKRVGKALVIHDRDAHEDVLRVLESEGAPDNVVFHCFSGDADFAKTCAERGYVMSFAGNVTFKNADDLRAAAASIPSELLLVETDAPFLTPMPYRGRPNSPYLVPLTVRALAVLRHQAEDDVAAAVWSTATRVFAWG